MILTTCPRCSESLRVPDVELPDDAYARCPWCSETFPASEIINSLPPIVQLLDAQGEPMTVSPAAVAAGLYDTVDPNPFVGAVDEPAPTDDAPDAWQDEPGHMAAVADQLDGLQVDDGGAVDIQIAPAESAVEADERPPTRVRTKRPVKKKSSPVMTLIGVALGPVLAIPLAIAILLFVGWMGWATPNLGFWPLDGSYNTATQKRSAAPPMDSSSAKGPPSFQSQTPRDISPRGSLLDGSSDVGQAVREITGDASPQSDTGSTGLTADQDSSALPKPTDIASAENQNNAAQDILDQLLNDDDPGNMDELEELKVPDGVAVYPGETQSVSKPRFPDDQSGESSSEIELKPGSVEIRDPEPNLEMEDVKAEPNETGLTIPEIKDIEPIEPDKSEPDLMIPELLLPAELNPSEREPTVAEPAELNPSEPMPAETVEDAFEPRMPNKQPVLEPEKPADSPELLATIKAASDALSGLQAKRDASASTPRDLATTYVAVSAIGTYDIDPASDAAGELLNKIAESPLLDDLSIAGPQWWKYATRPNDGMLLVGEPKSDAGGASMTLTGKSGTEVVPVVLPEGLQLPESTRAIAIGLITGTGDDAVVQLKAIQSL